MSLPKKKLSVAIIVYAALCMLFVIAAPQKTRPLNLPWGKEADPILNRPEIPFYRYVYGSPKWGQIHYMGTEDISGMANEVVLYYAHRKLSSALLILGAAGLNEDNCIRKYKQVVYLLNKKYGHYKYRSHVVDPLKEDLLYSRECYAIQLGLETIKTKWVLEGFRVESFLFGDESDIFIEVEYVFLDLEKEEKKSQQREDLKRL